jgi:riboflavin kinase/FMN adenylyltransferase
VHVLGFDGDLYAHEVQVRFLRRLRGERRFGGLDELKAQIARDVAAARQVHAGGDPVRDV